MNRRKAYTLFTLIILYYLLHYLQYHGAGPEFLRFYGKDLILVPVLILGISSTTTFFNIAIAIRLNELILTVLVCIISFEFIFPQFGMAFEKDFVDVFCYIAGGIIYYLAFLRNYDNHKKEVQLGT